MVSLLQYGYDIRGLRSGSGTYDLHEVPDMKDILNLTGDYSWVPSILKNKLVLKNNTWETFRDNEVLHQLVNSPTASYVRISTLDPDNQLIVFYRDQQDCILWGVNPDTGFVYASTDWTTPIANSVEEFWCRQWIESTLWFNSFEQFFLIADGTENNRIAAIIRKYASFYLCKKPDWIAKDIMSQLLFDKSYDGSDLDEITTMREKVVFKPLSGGTEASVFKVTHRVGNPINQNVNCNRIPQEVILRLLPENQSDEAIRRELLVTNLLGVAGLGPNVYYIDQRREKRPRGMVLEYIENKEIKNKDSPVLLRSIATQVGKLHHSENLRKIAKELQLNKVHKCYLSTLFHEIYDQYENMRNPIVPEYLLSNIKRIMEEADKILELTDEKDLVMCHNDLHPLNILFDGSKTSFIDWTYAGFGPRQFDLTYIQIMLQLDKQDTQFMLETYNDVQSNDQSDSPEKVISDSLVKVTGDQWKINDSLVKVTGDQWKINDSLAKVTGDQWKINDSLAKITGDQWKSLVWSFWLFWGLQTLMNKVSNDQEPFSEMDYISSYFEIHMNESKGNVDKSSDYITQLRKGELVLKSYTQYVEFIYQCFLKVLKLRHDL